MMPRRYAPLAAALCWTMGALAAFADDRSPANLPSGVKPVWDLRLAYRLSTPTRERICLNGLWHWQPASVATDAVPNAQWGYFKVPGPWPGITDYMQKDCQTLFPHPDWKENNFRNLTMAWHEREVSIPNEWSGRRISLAVEYLNSFAFVYVDGQKAGELRFPGGEVDLSALCRPGRNHLVSLLVAAMPLKGVLLSYTDSASAREVKGSVARRGLCGDVYLIGTRPVPRIAGVKVETSVRRWEISFQAQLEELDPRARYRLEARITDQGRSVAAFASEPFQAADLKDRQAAFTRYWKPEKLWDLHTASNQYDVVVSLLDAAGNPADSSEPARFGFRELWIQGRDFFLNGTRIFLSAVPLDNAEVGAAWATYQGARESLERLKSFGINFVYTHNYGCEPGSHLSFAEVLRAADDAGMLVALSQPHFSHYEWKSAEAGETNGYARHAAFYTGVAQNHPSVVFYSMSHNATGYNEDMNPDLIDGTNNPRDQWSLKNAELALRAEAIVTRLDPSRIVYHHASGNLGSMHAINFYPNFVPVQELSDWFGHWAAQGIKPAFLCEYGAPFTWDWTMYRGWFQGQREFGSARVPWEFCLAEWNAQFFGDRAFQISEPEKANLRWEAGQFRAGNLWHRWDYPFEVGSARFEERYPLFALYLTDNWRAFRGWGVSAISPWEYGHYWKLRDGVNKARQELPVDWEHLQRPGFSPDYIDQRYERMDLAFAQSDWVPTAAADALLRNNAPVLAFVGGKTAAFTSKDHNFRPGETVEKQLIIINNSRQTVTCKCQWSWELPRPVSGRQEFLLPTGDQRRIPVRMELPVSLAPGRYELNASVEFSSGETQRDRFVLEVLPLPRSAGGQSRIALFDPKGETAAWLAAKRIPFTRVEAHHSLAAYDTLVVGKSALSISGPAPDISGVAAGLKVLLFEQTAEVLEKRFGFRVEEYGLRTVFQRVPDHPLLAGLSPDSLRDWRGEATLLPPRLEYQMRPRHGPTVEWCGIPVTRLWRCGNRGNLASALMEKPARGNFLPVLDGGYALQYSPLLEYREGKGMMLFCQVDLTGRTEIDPAAERLAGNLLEYLSAWKPGPMRKTVYAGDPSGRRYLESIGLSPDAYEPGKLSSDEVLVVGPGGGAKLASHKEEMAAWLRGRGHLLAIALGQQEANSFLPFQIRTKDEEHISASFDPPATDSLLAGIAPADVHNRDPRRLPLISAGAQIIGDGVLARAENLDVVFCQLAPWQFDDPKRSNLKRTYRHISFLISRLLANMGAVSSTPILNRFATPVNDVKNEKRWLEGLYLDQPEEWDDPYRFFRW